MQRLTRRSFLVTAGLTAGAALLAACGGSGIGGNGTSSMPGMDHGPTATSGMGAMPGMGVTPGAATAGEYDRQFIDMMVVHHQAAIDMARVAQQHGEHAEIKQLAGAIIGAQDGQIARMEGWRKAWYGSDQIPAGTASGMAGMGGMDVDLNQLAGATPFDKAFIDAMIPHHQSAIAMAREAQTKATHPEITQLAGEIIAAQTNEIDQMQAWRAAWYPGQ